MEVESLCASVEECVIGSCFDTDCINPALALENCAAENYLGDFAAEPGCPDLYDGTSPGGAMYGNDDYNEEYVDAFIDGETDDGDHDDVSSQTLRSSSSTISNSQLESVF